MKSKKEAVDDAISATKAKEDLSRHAPGPATTVDCKRPAPAVSDAEIRNGVLAYIESTWAPWMTMDSMAEDSSVEFRRSNSTEQSLIVSSRSGLRRSGSRSQGRRPMDGRSQHASVVFPTDDSRGPPTVIAGLDPEIHLAERRGCPGQARG
jgi:hypothetical protein